MQGGSDGWGGTDMQQKQHWFVIPGGSAGNHEPEVKTAVDAYVATLKCTR
jgi:hypothetical protein